MFLLLLVPTLSVILVPATVDCSLIKTGQNSETIFMIDYDEEDVSSGKTMLGDDYSLPVVSYIA